MIVGETVTSGSGEAGFGVGIGPKVYTMGPTV